MARDKKHGSSTLNRGSQEAVQNNARRGSVTPVSGPIVLDFGQIRGSQTRSERNEMPLSLHHSLVQCYPVYRLRILTIFSGNGCIMRVSIWIAEYRIYNGYETIW